MSAPRLWKGAVASWQDPNIRLGLDGVLTLINPDPVELDKGARKWCRDCIELALVEGGAWSNPSAYATASGHPERVVCSCNSCEFKGCETHMDDHGDDTGHWSHPIELEDDEA